MLEANFSLYMTQTSPLPRVFQGLGAGKSLCWINAITVALACYRNATCMEGLSTGGKENVQLASKRQGCLQKNPTLYLLFFGERSARLFSPSLLAPLHSI